MKFPKPLEVPLSENGELSLLMIAAWFDNKGLLRSTVQAWNGKQEGGATIYIDDESQRLPFVAKIAARMGINPDTIEDALFALNGQAAHLLAQPRVVEGQDKPEAPRVQIITANDLLARDYPEPKWAVEGLIQEGVTLLAGAPKLGKSWLALALAIAVAEGGYALGTLLAEFGEALYLALEDGPRRLQNRLKKLLRGAGVPLGLHFATDWQKFDQGGLEDLDDWIRAHPNCRLVIIDTLKKVRPAERMNQNAYSTDYDALSPLAQIAQARGISILVVHHTNKMTSDDPVNLISGSLGLSGAADAVLVLSRQRGQTGATLFVTGRDVDEKELALKWDSDLANWRLLGDAQEQRKSDERQTVKELLQSALQPLSPTSVAGMLGKTVGSTKMLLWRMSRDNEIDVDNKGRYSLKGGYPGYSVTQPAQPTEEKEDREEEMGNRYGNSNFEQSYPVTEEDLSYPRCYPNEEDELPD